MRLVVLWFVLLVVVCRLFVELLVVNSVDCSGSFILCVLVMLVAICAWFLALLVVMICCCFG